TGRTPEPLLVRFWPHGQRHLRGAPLRAAAFGRSPADDRGPRRLRIPGRLPGGRLRAGSAHYGIYTYITLLVELLGFAGGIGVAMLLFGIGSVISVVVSARYIDAHLRAMFVGILALGGLSMAMLLVFRGAPGILPPGVLPLGPRIRPGGYRLSDCSQQAGG